MRLEPEVRRNLQKPVPSDLFIPARGFTSYWFQFSKLLSPGWKIRLQTCEPIEGISDSKRSSSILASDLLLPMRVNSKHVPSTFLGIDRLWNDYTTQSWPVKHEAESSWGGLCGRVLSDGDKEFLSSPR